MKEIDYKAYGDRVAILGASDNKSRISHLATTAFHHKGFEVYPINPREDLSELSILNKSYKSRDKIKVYKSLEEIPSNKSPHIISIYLNKERQDNLLEYQVLKSKPTLVIFNQGTINPHFINLLRNSGLEVHDSERECSISNLGLTFEELAPALS